jgi:hypothetical protein
MAKRPSELDVAGIPANTWVIEVDADDGAVTITETQKMTIEDIVALGSPPTPSWNNITLLNGWTGDAKYRVFLTEGYLEIFLNVSPGAASDDKLGQLTGGAVPDWIIRQYYSYITAETENSYLEISTDGSIRINGVLSAPINITFNFKVIINKP